MAGGPHVEPAAGRFGLQHRPGSLQPETVRGRTCRILGRMRARARGRFDAAQGHPFKVVELAEQLPLYPALKQKVRGLITEALKGNDWQ